MSPLGFKAKVGGLIYTWQRRMCYTFHEIGATPADLLAAELSIQHTCGALVGLKTRSYHAADVLPTALFRLGSFGTIEINFITKYVQKKCFDIFYVK